MIIPPVTGGNWRVWAEKLRRSLQNLSVLQRLTPEASAAQDGALLWDAAQKAPVVSVDGGFVPVLMGSASGWANYSDTAGAQALAANVPATYTVNAGSTYDLQKPDDVDTFWDSTNNKITGREGDAIVVKVQCDFTPDDATASTLDFTVDIGGAVGVVERQDFPISKGAGIVHHVSWTFLAYTLNTWEANGGTVSVVSDGPGNLTNKRIVIGRLHKAR